MHGHIIQVRRVGLSDVPPKVVGLGLLAEVLLLVGDVMLRARHDTGGLDTLDALGEHLAGEHRVGREALPVTAALGGPAEGPGDGAKLHVYALAGVLLAHALAAEVGQVAVPGGGDIDAGGEDADEVGVAHAGGAVLETHGPEAETGDGAGLADALVGFPSRAGGQIDLLLQCELADEGACLGVGVSPVAESFTPCGTSACVSPLVCIDRVYICKGLLSLTWRGVFGRRGLELLGPFDGHRVLRLETRVHRIGERRSIVAVLRVVVGRSHAGCCEQQG